MDGNRLIDLVFLVCAVIGQILAIRSSRENGVLYYVCLAPIGYFQWWLWGTWDVARLCGVVLATTEWWSAHRASRTNGGLVPLAVFGAYGVVVTLVMSRFWPIESMAGASSAYGPWRWLVQILNWLIMLGVARQVALCRGSEVFLHRLRAATLPVGALLCAYAVYQYAAYQYGLPATGIRRTFGFEEEVAAYATTSIHVPRPGSLVGEPKGLGLACVFWIAVWLLPGRPKQRLGRGLDYLMGALIAATLWLTASTSAWAGAMSAVGYAAAFRAGRRRLLLKVVAGVFFVLATVNFTQSLGAPALRDVVEARWTSRIQEPLNDASERLTLELLAQRPMSSICGFGLGGVSFYLAEALGGGQVLILAPNNGFLTLLTSVGVVGLALLSWIAFSSISVIVRTQLPVARGIGAVATAVLTQCLIFPQDWLFSVALGLLASVTVANGQHAPRSPGGARTPARTIVGGSPPEVRPLLKRKFQRVGPV